jgi:predicted extracellular nuclease
LASYQYLPILLEGTDSRGIDVGYLVRSDMALIMETMQHDAPEGITSRPPLEIVLETINGSSPITLHIINNHFTSMSGGEKATEPRRNAQAEWNKAIIEKIVAADPQIKVIITGDLNSYYDSPPIAILRSAGLMHVFDVLPTEERYTYIYEGISQTLDHILMSSNLYEIIDGVYILHINADYTLPLAGDESPVHKSDHDPVIVIYDLEK